MTWKSLGDELKSSGIIGELQRRALLKKQESDQLRADSRTNQENEHHDCPICKDQGGWLEKQPVPFVDGKIYPMDAWVECSCAERHKINKLFAFSEITPQMQSRNFENFKIKNRPECVAFAYEAAKQYLNEFDEIKGTQENSIFLGGIPGSGKTHLLLAIANALIERGVPVIYFPFVEGLDELRSEIRENGPGYQKKLESLQRAPVLLIDDLYKSKKGDEPTKFEIKFLFSVINYRYLNHLPILISSELTIDQVLFWDHAIGSRIYQMAGRSVVHLTDGKGLNYRLITLPDDFR